MSASKATLFPRRFTWTDETFYLAAEARVFDGKRVELINGEVIEFPPMRDDHAWTIRKLTRILSAIFQKGYSVQVQMPMNLGRKYQPEPDLAVLVGDEDQHRKHPTTALLVIEVAERSLLHDRSVKAAMYAAANVTEYWIIDLQGRCVEVHRQPGSEGYATRRVIADGQDITGGVMPQPLSVATILP